MLKRPLLVLGGWRSASFMARGLARRLTPLTNADPAMVRSVSYPWVGRFDEAVETAQAEAERLANDHGSREIDIVAISMGGLVARAIVGRWKRAGRTSPRVRTIFTLGTPHRGAALARWIRPDDAARFMRPGSPRLRALDEELGGWASDGPELVCYAQRLDWWVGTNNTAPPGREAMVFRARGVGGVLFSHFTVGRHPEVLEDLARRLLAS